MTDDPWTIRRCLEWTQTYLSENADINARLSAQWLLAAATGLSRLQLYLQYDQPLTTAERAWLRTAIRRRLRAEPLQYITGRAVFRHLELGVRAGVLIPRPETEILVDLVIEALGQPLLAAFEMAEPTPSEASTPPPLRRILDVGTGSGAIALALLWELEAITVLATDISPEALAVAAENAAALGFTDTQLCLVEDDLATAVLADSDNHASFAAVVANLPYIPEPELVNLPLEVSEYEPLQALAGGFDGLRLYARLLPQAYALLEPGGLLAVELYETKLTDAAELAEEAGFSDIHIHDDLTGRPRFLTAHR